MFVFPGEASEAQAATNAKIHYLTLPDNTLSVLVECNGKFGMIDSEEDTDYPKGTDSRYPARAHITTSAGYESEVIAYLKSVGVTTNNFEFYIGTHPHSDHISSADEVIKAFKPKTVYLQEYKDSYITDSNALWDNLYVYDSMVNAAKSVGATLIQNINSSNANFTLGDGMEIQIKHYGESYKTNPVPDANYFSLGVLVKANGKSAFVAGDINNFDGSETVLKNQLGHVDVLTLGHHGSYGSNSNAYVTGLTPKMLILPGTYSYVSTNALAGDKSMYETLNQMAEAGVPMYATGLYTDYIGAIVINFNSSLSTNIPSNVSVTATSYNCVPSVKVTYKDGFPVSIATVSQWLQDSTGWWYRHADGSYTTNGWELIDGTWYYFNSSGYMATGWQQIKGTWYYLGSDGKMRTGWQQVDGQWYYFDSEGAMQTGWINLNGTWYYLNSEGAMQTGWINLNGTWYYLNSDGAMLTGWQEVDGSYYYMNSDGAMLTGWQTISGSKYYLGSDGARRTGWQTISGSTYYFDSNGKMAVSKWVDGKYLNGSGVYVPNQWIKQSGRWWYKHGDGSYTTSNWEEIDGQWYYFDASGWMVTGWLQLGSDWYYLNSDGAKVTNAWVEGYYLDANGKWVQ